MLKNNLIMAAMMPLLAGVPFAAVEAAMPRAITQLTDIGVLPVNITDYILQQSIQTNAFWQSGIIRQDVGATAQSALDNGGYEVIFPFFNDLTGSGQIAQENTNITIGKVSTGSGKAPVLQRSESWGATDLVADYSGNDPMKIIADRVAAFWQRHYSGALLSVMSGAIGAVSANVLDISGLTGANAVISASTFIDAEALLGDRRQKLAAVGMHSKTVAVLRKQGLIQYIPPQAGLLYAGDYFGKYRVIEDDTMTIVSAGIYVTYLFAEGSVLFGEGGVKTPEEVERQALVNHGQEYLVSRKRFMFVPTGVSFTGTPAATSPPNATNAELATTGNWTLKYDQKNIGVVKFIHKLA